MTATAQKIEAPVSDSSTVYESLGYVEARDAVLHCEYAYVAWKETSRSDGTWRVRIKGNQTAGATFEPDAIAKQSLIAMDTAKSFFTWGYNFEPSMGDPRQVEFRVHVTPEGKPSKVEMIVRLRKADHSAGEMKTTSFNWPA
jgi:hypothetical protein